MSSWVVIFGMWIIELVCCNPVGHPVRLWTAGTVGWQCVLSINCVQRVSLMSPLSLSLRGEMSASSDERAWESDFNVWSVMSQSVSIHFSVVLNAVQHNWPHSKPNTVVNLQVSVKCLRGLTCHMLLLHQGTGWTVELKADISMRLPFPKPGPW